MVKILKTDSLYNAVSRELSPTDHAYLKNNDKEQSLKALCSKVTEVSNNRLPKTTPNDIDIARADIVREVLDSNDIQPLMDEFLGDKENKTDVPEPLTLIAEKIEGVFSDCIEDCLK